MRFWSPIPKMLHGRSTSVARTLHIHRWCLPSHWFRAKAGRRFISTPRKLNNNVRHALEEFTDVRAPDDLARDLGKLRDKTVRLDQASAADAFTRLLADHGGKPQRGADPIALLKATKNHAEIVGSRAAHKRDGVAVVRFLAWFDKEAPSGKLTEIDAVAALESFRRDTGALKDISFPTIAGAGPNGAIVHYRVTRTSNRRIGKNELFLIDSGAQYEDGTTDITRTIVVGEPSEEMRDRFTRVLKGHIADRHRRLSREHQRRPARSAGAHGACGRQASISTTARDMASAAICRCTRARRASPSLAPSPFAAA